MSTHPALMAVESFLPELSAPESKEIGNASNRNYTFVYDSRVEIWAPGEVRQVQEFLGTPVDKWGVPEKISKDLYEIGPNGEKVIPRRLLVTKTGGALSMVLTKLFSDPGCPLYPVKHDGRDDDRKRIAENKYRAFRLPQAEATIEEHRAQCRRDVNAGFPPPPKPSHVRDAEYDKEMFKRTIRSGQGRYIIKEDGDSFDFLDDAKAHILRNWPEHEVTWRSLVMDSVGGPNAVKAVEEPEDPGEVQGPDPGSGAMPQSPQIARLIRLAEKSGKVLPDELLARQDDPDDEDALEDAMTFIMAEDKPDMPSRLPGETNRQYKARVAAIETLTT